MQVIMNPWHEVVSERGIQLARDSINLGDYEDHSPVLTVELGDERWNSLYLLTYNEDSRIIVTIFPFENLKEAGSEFEDSYEEKGIPHPRAVQKYLEVKAGAGIELDPIAAQLIAGRWYLSKDNVFYEIVI